jgi:hypothetical protein
MAHAKCQTKSENKVEERKKEWEGTPCGTDRNKTSATTDQEVSKHRAGIFKRESKNKNTRKGDKDENDNRIHTET